MAKILVTGANGYIGARLSKFLFKKGHQVIAHCYPSSPSDPEWLRCISRVVVGDIRDNDVITELAGLEVECIIHLISLDHNQCNFFEPNDILAINVTPTWNLLENFRHKNLKRFIYFSTFQVYGKIKNDIVTEETRSDAQNIYALTHLLSENIVNYYHTATDMDCLSVRLSNSYGSPVFSENNCWWLVINELCQEAYKNNVILLKSDGSPLRDFIHFSDIGNAVDLLIKKGTKTKANTFNLCSGKTYTILELAHIIKAVFAKRYSKEIDILLPGNIISNDISALQQANRYRIDNNKLRELGFSPQFTLEDGVNELFDYLEKLQ